MNWQELRRDVQKRREAGEAVGIGLGMFVEKRAVSVRLMAWVTVDMGDVEVVTDTGVGRAGRRNRHRADLRQFAR